MPADMKKLTLEYLEDTGRWPYPFLPLIKRGEWDSFSTTECGFVIVDNPKRLYAVNLFASVDEIEKAPVKDYETLQALVDDRWEVD